MPSSSTLIFHRGALGDVILIWPLLRELKSAGDHVTFISDGEKARLTACELSITALDIEQPRFNALWADSPASNIVPDHSIDLVISTVAAAGSPWHANTAIQCPRASIEFVPAPLTRINALELVDRYAGPSSRNPIRAPDDSSADLALSASSPILFHVGAGSPAKRWPMTRWQELARQLPQRSIQVIAGEVEADRFSAGDRANFNALHGRFITTLRELADTMKRAALVVGADSGPMHLAAQLGRPTLTLFGPTDPTLWAPIAAAPSTPARTIAPPAATLMTWLDAARVLESIRTFNRIAG